MEKDVLEEMKRQIAVLNSELDKEEIISEDMIRRAIGKDYSWVTDFLGKEGLGLGFITLYFGVSGFLGDMKWWICVALIALCAFEYFRNIKYLKIREEEISNLPLLDIQQRMNKNPHRISLIVFEVIAAAISCLWLFQVYQQDGLGRFLAFAIGGIIGGAIGIYQNHKIKKTRSTILSNIVEWTSHEDIDELK